MYNYERKEKLLPKGEGQPAPPPCGKLNPQMKQYLEDRGLSYTVARYNGWYPCIYWGQRICIPATTLLNPPTYWQARTMEGHPMRFMSSKVSRGSAIIIVSHPELGTQRPHVALCEGPMDALAIAEIPGWMAIAVMGVNPTAEQLAHIFKVKQVFSPQEMMIMSDKDSVAQWVNIQRSLLWLGMSSQLRYPLDKKDIACYTLKQREEILGG